MLWPEMLRIGAGMYLRGYVDPSKSFYFMQISERLFGYVPIKIFLIWVAVEEPENAFRIFFERFSFFKSFSYDFGFFALTFFYLTYGSHVSVQVEFGKKQNILSKDNAKNIFLSSIFRDVYRCDKVLVCDTATKIWPSETSEMWYSCRSNSDWKIALTNGPLLYDTYKSKLFWKIRKFIISKHYNFRVKSSKKNFIFTWLISLITNIKSPLSSNSSTSVIQTVLSFGFWNIEGLAITLDLPEGSILSTNNSKLEKIKRKLFKCYSTSEICKNKTGALWKFNKKYLGEKNSWVKKKYSEVLKQKQIILKSSEEKKFIKNFEAKKFSILT